MTKERYYTFGWIFLIMGIAQIPLFSAMPVISDAEAFLNSMSHIKDITETHIIQTHKNLMWIWATPIIFSFLLILTAAFSFKESSKFIYSFTLSLVFYVYTANIFHIIETPATIVELITINTGTSLMIAYSGAINNLLYPISYIIVLALYINHLTRRSSGTREKASRAP